MADPLDALRSLMASHSPPLDALIVPSEDNHQSEYVSARDKRREFVSKFTGSAGLALVTKNEALLWTDGRYFLQATQQLSERWKLMRIGEDPTVETWIADNIPSEGAVGIDPWCVSVETAQRWDHAFSRNKQKLIQLSTNLVDEVWKDRPPADILPVVVHPLEFTGCSVAEKLKDLREKLIQEKAYGIIITALDEVAWLYNVRGNDVAYSPVVHAYAIVTVDSAFFYVDKRKVNSEVQAYMVGNGIEVREYEIVDSDVSLLASGQLICSYAHKETHDEVQRARENGRTWIDPVSCCLALYSKLASDRVLMQPSPLALAKAVKSVVLINFTDRSNMGELESEKHVKYIVSIEKKKDDFEALVMEHLRLSGAYWGLTTLDLLHKISAVDPEEVVSWVMKCYHDDCGGFGGNVGHDPHLLHTLSAMQILALFDRIDALDVEKVSNYVAGLQNEDGSFSGDMWGEIDTRFSYCAICSLSILRRLNKIDVEKAVNYIVSCKNLDGGFGSIPGGESHAGQIFCCVGALAITGSLHHIDRDLLGWWLCERQGKDGGLNGRPEKLADVCYSWWVLSSLIMIDRVHWIDKDKLARFILNCQDKENGGISDRPDNAVDVFHTYFGVAGLSLMEYPGLKSIDPAYALPVDVVNRIFFGK